MILERILEIYKSNKGGTIGLLIGFIIGVAILCFGFFKVVFVAILAAIGYYIGKKVHEDRDYIKKILDRVLPPGSYR
jgi:uncharacterized membrane protein